MFTKKNLKTGMVVELENGEKYITLTGNLLTHNYGIQNIMFVDRGNRFMTGESYNEALICKNDGYSIAAVYLPNIRGLECVFDDANKTTLIWKRKPKVDWSKVPIDTKVLVRENKKCEWVRRHFAKVDNDGKTFAFENGTTSFTGYEFSEWKEMILYEGNEHLEGEENNNDRI